MKELKLEDLKTNEWLEGKTNFDLKKYYHDHYYLETLSRYILHFLRNAPVPVKTVPKKNKIIFSVGYEQKIFDIDNTISYYDFLTLIKRWLSQFFPQYNVVKEVERPYTDEEIIQMKFEHGEDFDINEALKLTKKETIQEHGVIEKITLKSDEFTLSINDNKYIYMSGTVQRPLPLSLFLKEVRGIAPKYFYEALDSKGLELKEGVDIYKAVREELTIAEYNDLQNKISNEVRNYIFDNSTKIKYINDDEKEIIISHPGRMMVNFFKVNYPDLKDKKLIEVEQFVYRWGRYKIKFESLTLLNDCINYYNKMKG